VSVFNSVVGSMWGNVNDRGIYTALHVVYDLMKIRSVEWNDHARKGFLSSCLRSTNTRNVIFMLHGTKL
jgi:hypothetical protein